MLRSAPCQDLEHQKRFEPCKESAIDRQLSQQSGDEPAALSGQCFVITPLQFPVYAKDYVCDGISPVNLRALAFLALAAVNLTAQDAVQTDSAPPEENQPGKWNLYFQATSIGQYHPAFDSPYSGPFSLLAPPRSRSFPHLHALLRLCRLARNTLFVFDPEIAGGRGFSGTNGIANFPNGEMPRVATATPKPYIARLYVTQDFGFGDARESVESDENQLAGSRPVTRYSITVGRFTVTDFFDNNRYSHDPRTQFMGWAIMYNGAWDYPADTRGYTWGWVHEFHTPHWSLPLRQRRRASRRQRPALRPPAFSRPRRHVRRRSTMPRSRGHDGAVRLLSYQNHADIGHLRRRAAAGGADRHQARRHRRPAASAL